MILHARSPWLREALARALVAMAVSESYKGQCWAKRSAATLSRRLRRDRQRADLLVCAGQALAQLPSPRFATSMVCFRWKLSLTMLAELCWSFLIPIHSLVTSTMHWTYFLYDSLPRS